MNANYLVYFGLDLAPCEIASFGIWTIGINTHEIKTSQYITINSALRDVLGDLLDVGRVSVHALHRTLLQT